MKLHWRELMRTKAARLPISRAVPRLRLVSRRRHEPGGVLPDRE